MKKINLYFAMVAATILLSGLATNPANALTFMPGDEILQLTFNSNCNATCLETQLLNSLAISTNLVEQYKDNAPGQNPQNEVGPFAPYYSTVYSSGNENSTTTWDGPNFISCGECYFLVKDGNNTPNQYVFNLNNWDGKETIHTIGLWPNKGSISHVSIFTGDRNIPPGQVPEPGTIFLLGSGLVGVGFWRWKTKK